MALINAAGNEIDSKDLYYGSEQSPKSWSSSVNLEKGTYYLKVNKYSSYTGTYTLKVKTFSNVPFNSNGGTQIASQSVAYNGKSVKPSDPTKAGYVFGGWYKESTLVNPFDFANTQIIFTNTVLTTGTTYYYKVRAYKTVGTTRIYSAYSTVVSSKPIPTQPVSVQSVSAGYNSTKTSCNSVVGATGYEIFKSASSTGTYSKVGETTSTSYINTGLTTGTIYYYKVRTYKTVGTTRIYSNYSTVVNSKPVPSVPTNFKATKVNSTSINLTFTGVSGASGYEIYKSTSSAGPYSLLKSTTALSYTNVGLSSGKAYYYKIRSYRLIGTTKIYSNWSPAIYSQL
ncbi:MAG: fibronectin type III domain-containing protein [Clostridiaceae bacterium]